jgi:hypothetical protein
VRPTPISRPADSAEAPVAEAPVADAKTPPDHTPPDRTPADRTPADRASAAAPLPIARPAQARVRPDAPLVTAAPAPAPVNIAPPAAAMGQSAPLPLGATDPALQPPVTVNSASGAEPDPEPRGFASNVFSSLSALAGTAANATGNTVNWVIDLPGKAISAGGRLLGGDSSASNQPAASPPPSGTTAPPPATVPPPATAPPPKRNL